MIQKLKEYQVKRAANKSYNEIGEEIAETAVTFTIKMCIAVASGDNGISNLIKSTNSTHTGIYFEGDLKVGDLIIDGDAQYQVKYVYPKAVRKIVNLELCENG